VAASESVETSPRRAARDEVTHVPIISFLPLQLPASLDEGPQSELSKTKFRLRPAKILVNVLIRDCRHLGIHARFGFI
jgi:hypothetical protein